MIERAVLRWFRELIAIIIAAVAVSLAVWLIHNGLVAVHAASYDRYDAAASSVAGR